MKRFISALPRIFLCIFVVLGIIVVVLGIMACHATSVGDELPNDSSNTTPSDNSSIVPGDSFNDDSSTTPSDDSNSSFSTTPSNNSSTIPDAPCDTSSSTTVPTDESNIVVPSNPEVIDTTSESETGDTTSDTTDVELIYPLPPIEVANALYTYWYNEINDVGTWYGRQSKLNDALKKAYWDGSWDGSYCQYDISTYRHFGVELDDWGYIELNGDTIPNNVKTTIDLPLSFEDQIGPVDDCNIEYVPGDGTYVIIEETFMKFVKGKQVPLDGSDLSWKKLDGADTEYGHAILHYSEAYDRMFLSVPMVYDYSHLGEEDYKFEPPIGYLYVFKDYKNSKDAELVSRIYGFYENEDGFFYEDSYHVTWKYCEGENGTYSFEKVNT